MSKPEKILLIISGVLFALGIFSVFDKILPTGLIFCIFLSVLTLLFFLKIKNKSKELYALFVIVFLFHIATVLFVYYAQFQPFSNGLGDFVEYNQNAEIINSRLHSGDFSVGGLKNTSHYYSVLIGYIYFFTLPSALVGQLFNAWLSALISVLAYFIVVEISGSRKKAVLTGSIVAIYPSLLFYGSLLLKDALVALLSLCAIFLTIRLIKGFKYNYFILFYLVAGSVFHFRFYIGFAVIFTFVVCWALFSNLDIKKRIIYLLVFAFLFGFLPQIFMIDKAGYWGSNLFKQYFNQKTISYYREVAYAPVSQPIEQPPTKPQESENNNLQTNNNPQTNNNSPEKSDTSGSTFGIETNFSNPILFIKGYITSFIYTVLSPLPWQIKYKRQLFALIESIPWYILLFFIIKGIIKNFKTHYKVFSPLLLFGIIILGNIALFINNFGIITRIRIPAFICLLCFLTFGIKENSVVYKYPQKIYNYSKKWLNK